jgi:L-aminopeptidase/D-esterase-like protein
MPCNCIRSIPDHPDARRYNRRVSLPKSALVLGLVGVAGAVIALSAARDRRQSPGATPSSATRATITTIPGITVGQFTLPERLTGCTVIMAAGGAVGGVDVRGGAPGTVETDLLNPQNTVERVNAVFLSGGSAFGLDTRSGVVKYLDEKKVGYATAGGPVPIVTGAILYDLTVGGHPEIRPGADCGYRAASTARAGDIEEGNVGAGAGATVGKTMGAGRAMKGGIGATALVTTDGLMVGAIVAVNAVGSVVDPRTGKPIAGVRTSDGRSLEDPFALVRRGVLQQQPGREATTIGVIATNARLSKAQARKVAEMAHDGMARSIVPSHTPSDGDTLFVLATGGQTAEPNVGTIGALAAEAVADAIVRAVRAAKGIPGFPGSADIVK